MTYLTGHIGFALLAIAGLAAIGTGATGLEQFLFGLDSFPLQRLLFSFGLLQAAVFAVTPAFSADGREAGRVALAGVLVALALLSDRSGCHAMAARGLARAVFAAP